MGQFMMSPPAILFWIAALAIVLARQSGKLWQAKGEHWWHHCCHFVMLVAMVAMYCAMVFGKDWFPRGIWVCVYSLITVAILIWIVIRRQRHGSVGQIWPLALVSQVAMIYMCLPVEIWLPIISYAFAIYFAFEGLSWLRHSFRDQDTGGSEISPRRRPNLDAFCMTIMAASMGYMFVGMQLKASERQNNEIGAPRLEKPNTSPSSLASASQFGLPSVNAEASHYPELNRYTVVPGDTLFHIAARFYGDHRRWTEILKANPGLNPGSLRPGQIIMLGPIIRNSDQGNSVRIKTPQPSHGQGAS